MDILHRDLREWGDGCHISQEGDEGERRKVKRKDEVRVGVRGGQKEKDRRAWEE